MSTIIPLTEEANLGILSKTMAMEGFQQTSLAPYIGFTTKKKDSLGRDMEVTPPSPIVMKKEFMTQGNDFMLVPMLKNLTQAPIYGDQQAVNNGEAQALNYNKVYINQLRGVVAPPPRMGNQRVKTLNLVESARPQITDWFARVIDVEAVSGLYEGFSRNITAATSVGGRGATKIQHPNICSADTGRITYNATTATYATNIHTKVSGMTAAAEFKMSKRALDNFKTECDRFQIPYFKVKGMPVRPLFIHLDQHRQLQDDDAAKDALANGAPRDILENPLFSGAIAYMSGFALMVREFGVFGITTAATPTVTWGATNPLSALDTYSVKGAYTFGPYAICGGWAWGPNFTREELDHQNHQELGVNYGGGFARADYFDSTGTPTSVINKTSALLLTYSPAAWL